MSYTPTNDLEKAMLQAAQDPQALAPFYHLLLSSKLIALGSFGETMALETVRGPTGEYHPIFTSPERVKALIQDPTASFAIEGRRLFQITKGAQFVLNPGWSPDKILTADEIEWCLKTFPPSGELIVAQPKVFPKRLVKALCVLFTSRAAIEAAHLVYVARDGIDTRAHPMIGLEADGDVPRLAQEIFAAAAAVLPGEPVEVIYLDHHSPLNPLQKHLLSVPPFYRRAQPLN
jgi:hypothetical protein